MLFVVQLRGWASILNFAPHGVVECHLALGQIGGAVYIQAGKITQLNPQATVGAITVRLFKQTARTFAELAFLSLDIPGPKQQKR
ncbi:MULTISPECIES: hypothetical protein [unclassified Pseudovibrio]|uniref:hypothetical protein n=1 Tax=unclassified Pseudovibrio TaxID=2627060 RepID=UPI0007AEAD2F|nr:MULTISPECIES: hypothetical protein [unclassified Pseudovibrio]